MSFIKVILLLCLLNLRGFDSLGQVHYLGSYSITAKGKDGIIMVADTRGSLIDQQNWDSVFAYFDTVQKIFIVKNCALSITGLIAVSDKFLSYYITQFEKLLPSKDMHPGDLLILFHKFYSNNYPQLKSEFLKLYIVAAKYVGDSAEISFMNQGVVYDDLISVASDTLSDFQNYDNGFLNAHTCNELTSLIIKSIDNYVIKFNKHNKIGGPYMALKISPKNEFTWTLYRPQKPNWNTVEEFHTDYLNGKVKLIFSNSEIEARYKEWLINLMK